VPESDIVLLRTKIKHLLPGIVGILATIALVLTAWRGVTVAKAYQEAGWLETVNTLADEAIRANAIEAKERGLTATSLSKPASVTGETRERLKGLRQSGDGHYAKAKALAEQLAGRAPSHPVTGALADLAAARHALEQARLTADRRLDGQQVELTPPQWVSTSTAFIAALAQLRRDAMVPDDDIEKALQDNTLIKEIVYQISEFAGRERALLGTVIADGRPLTTDEARLLGHFRVIVEGHLDRLEQIAKRQPTDTPLALAVGQMRTEFLGRFQRTRTAIYQASASHRHYSVTGVEWFDTATAGIDSVLAVGEAVSRETAARVTAIKRQQFQQVVILAVVIGLVALMLVAAVWIVLQRILRPMDRMVGMLKDIAEGEGDLTRRVRIQADDEIGEMALWFNRFIDQIARMVTVTSHTANEVAAVSQQLSANTDEVARATSQVTYSVSQWIEGTTTQTDAVSVGYDEAQQIASMAATVANRAEHAAQATAAVANAAESSRQELEGAVRRVQALQTAITDSARVISSLGRHAEQIDSIVVLIQALASQTNLLALNAAIEAARAGEHGRGFAVVAEEVRKLASESAQGAQQITERISEIQTDTREAIRAMEEGTAETDRTATLIASANSAMAGISTDIQQTHEAVAAISHTVGQLHQGLGTLTQTIEQVAAVAFGSSAGAEEVSACAQQQNASIEEIASSAQSLAQMAGDLQALVGRFRTDAALSRTASEPALIAGAASAWMLVG
jgi:methyl-accepting chemotaxis protein